MFVTFMLLCIYFVLVYCFRFVVRVEIICFRSNSIRFEFETKTRKESQNFCFSF
jgi:hypothetical protein